MTGSVRVSQFNDSSSAQNTFVPSENIDLPTLRKEIALFLSTFDFTPFLPKQKRLEDLLDSTYDPSFVYAGQLPQRGVMEKASRVDHVHGMPNFGDVNVAFAGQPSYPGVSGEFSRADHSHGSPEFPYGSIFEEITFGTLKHDGLSGQAARADHRHGNPVFPYGLQSLAMTPGVVSNVGGSTKVARDDHVHGLPNWGTPVNVGAANSPGSQSLFSRSDHVHALQIDNLPLSNAVVTEKTFNQNESAGISSTFSRGDHTHGSPSDALLVHLAGVETISGAKTFLNTTTRFGRFATFTDPDPNSQYAVKIDGGLAVSGVLSFSSLNVTGATTLNGTTATSLTVTGNSTLQTTTIAALTVSGSFTGNVIQSANIVDGTIATVDLGPRVVTGAKVALDTITGGTQAGEGNIGANTIYAYNLADDITAEAADNSITGGPLGAGVKIRQNTITHHNIFSKSLRNSNMILGGQPLDDPSFRWSQTDTPWKLGTLWSIVEGQGRDGQRCAQRIGGPETNLENGFEFDCSAGDVYSATLWAKNGTVAPNGTMQIKIAFYSQDRAFITYGTTLLNAAVAPTASWAQATVITQAPAGTSYAVVRAVPSNHLAGMWLVDDFACQRSIGTNQILDAAVTLVKIADRAISTVKMQLDSVTEEILGPLSVYTDALQNAVVTLPKLANDAVSNDKIVNGTIQAFQKIAPGSITADLFRDPLVADQIGSGSVTNPSIVADAVTGNVKPPGSPADTVVGQIADRTIAATNIVFNTITGAEITNQTLELAGGLNVTGQALFNNAMQVTGHITGTSATLTGTLTAGASTLAEVISNGNGQFTGYVHGRRGGTIGEAFRVGNDLSIWDQDQANTAVLRGMQDATIAYLRFGSTGQTLGGNSTGLFVSGTEFRVGNSQVVRQVDAAATVTAATTYANGTALGTSLGYARADHSHGSPPTPVTTLATSGNLAVDRSFGSVTLTLTPNPSFVTETITSFTTYGSVTRQMINLWGAVPNSAYGIGVQSATTYFRTGSAFSWFQNGTHADTQNDPGVGGTRLMQLDANGNLLLKGTLAVNGTAPGGAGNFAADNAVVHIAGAETITGAKTFTPVATFLGGATLGTGQTLTMGGDIVFTDNVRRTIYANNANTGLQVRSSGIGTLQLNADNAGNVDVAAGGGSVNLFGQVTAVSGNLYVGTGTSRHRFTDDGVYAYHQTDRDVVFSAVGSGVQRARLTTVGNLLLAGTLDVGGNGLTGLGVDRHSFAIKAGFNVSGGGTVSVNGTGEITWTQRFIVISGGFGAHASTNGFFDITVPPSGTVITGVGAAANVTATTNGVALGAWQALYYILPIGSGSGVNNGNFRVASYTAALQVPDNWLLVAARNGDTSTYKICTGQYLTLNSQVDNTKTTLSNDANYVHIAGTETITGFKTFNGAVTFNQAPTMPAAFFGAPVSEQQYGLPQSNGTSLQVARSDHSHGSVPAQSWAAISGKPSNWLTQTNLTGDQASYANSVNTLANRQSGFWQVDPDGVGKPVASKWHHIIQARHSNTANNYVMQLAMPFDINDLYIRNVAGGNGSDASGATFTSWAKVYSTANLSPVDTTSDQTVGGLKTFSRRAAFNASTGSDYTGAGLELFVSGSTVRPRISFHMGGVVASQIAMDSDGWIAIRNNPGTSLEKIRAAVVEANNDFNIRGLNAINGGDSYLRINQSTQFASGIWFGTSPLRMDTGGIYVGSGGGDGQVAILGGNADRTRRITLDGTNGNLTISGTLSVGTFNPGIQYLSNNPLYLRTPGDTNHYLRYESDIDGAGLTGWQGVSFYRMNGGRYQIGRIDNNGNMYIPGTMYSNNGTGGQAAVLTANSLYLTDQLVVGNFYGGSGIRIGTDAIWGRFNYQDTFRISTNGYATFAGSLETGPSGTSRIRLYNDTNSGFDRDALQYINTGNSVDSEIRGSMGIGGRGIYVNAANIQIGHTQAVIHQVGKRYTSNPNSSVRVRAGYFSRTTTNGDGTIDIFFGSGMDQAPSFVVITPEFNTESGSSIGFIKVRQVYSTHVHALARLDGGQVPGNGTRVTGYYYAEVTI